jgi:acyl-CoA synthetase (AMP-forming)/AMP-acid ligase II
MMLGAIPSIMPPPSPKQRHDLFWSGHATLYERLQPKWIIASSRVRQAYESHLPEFASRIVEPAGLAKAEQSAGAPLMVPEPGDIAFVQHSSGTTALKKGVALTHEKVVRHIDRYAHFLGLNSDSVIASWLPIYHDMGLIACFMLPICQGATVIVLDPLEWSARPQRLLEAIDGHDATHVWLPNFAFEHLCNGTREPQKYDLSSLKAVIDCSEPCRRASLERFSVHFTPSGLGPKVVGACYAMAENVFAVTQTPIGRPIRVLRIAEDAIGEGFEIELSGSALGMDVVSCGFPLPGIQLRIVNEQRTPLSDNFIGEIAIATDTLFEGYLGDEDLSKAALDGEWYYTGDLGFIAGGELFVLGRRDDMIVAFGRNILAYEVEAVLNQINGIIPGRAVAFAVESDRLGTRELAVMCEASEGIAADAIKKSVRAAIEASSGLAPRHVVVLSKGSLAKTTSGKISRSANRQLFLAGLTQTPESAT